MILNFLKFKLQLNSNCSSTKELHNNMFSNINNNNNNSELKNESKDSINLNQIKVKKRNDLTQEKLKQFNQNEGKNILNDNANLKKKDKIYYIKNCRYSGEALKGVELNRTFYSILKNKISKNMENTENIYSPNEFCLKFCGEKLFKNLDLNQRFSLKKSGKLLFHNKLCPFYSAYKKHERTNSIPISFREKRKISLEKDLTFVYLSGALARANSIICTSSTYNAKQNINDNCFLRDEEKNIKIFKNNEKQEEQQYIYKKEMDLKIIKKVKIYENYKKFFIIFLSSKLKIFREIDIQLILLIAIIIK